jgi:hypothetical protein
MFYSFMFCLVAPFFMALLKLLAGLSLKVFSLIFLSNLILLLDILWQRHQICTPPCNIQAQHRIVVDPCLV